MKKYTIQMELISEEQDPKEILKNLKDSFNGPTDILGASVVEEVGVFTEEDDRQMQFDFWGTQQVGA